MTFITIRVLGRANGTEIKELKDKIRGCIEENGLEAFLHDDYTGKTLVAEGQTQRRGKHWAYGEFQRYVKGEITAEELVEKTLTDQQDIDYESRKTS